MRINFKPFLFLRQQVIYLNFAIFLHKKRARLEINLI
nr:MAG TPA: hypothetical protein [Caudoviricetes sp.]